jgi:hypothetical protein
MDALVSEFDGVTIAHETATVAGLDDDLAPVVEVSSPLKAQNSREVGDIRPPVDGGPCVDEAVLGDELVALVQGVLQVVLHAPPEVDLLEVYQQFVGRVREVDRIGGVGVD